MACRGPCLGFESNDGMACRGPCLGFESNGGMACRGAPLGGEWLGPLLQIQQQQLSRCQDMRPSRRPDCQSWGEAGGRRRIRGCLDATVASNVVFEIR